MLTKNKLPCERTRHGGYQQHKRNVALIRKNNGQIMKYRDLPVESQLALVQYMAIDGEARRRRLHPEVSSSDAGQAVEYEYRVLCHGSYQGRQNQGRALIVPSRPDGTVAQLVGGVCFKNRTVWV